MRKTERVHARNVRTTPSDTALSAFGLVGSLHRLSGGQETAWLVEGVVLKPLDMTPVMLAWQHTLLSRLAGRDDFRVSTPVRTTDGAFIADGWTAWRYESGSQRERWWPEIIEVGRQFHRALAMEPEPPFLRGRTDPWSIADKVAWGELPATEHASDRHLSHLLAALAPVHGRMQLVHGDLTGNVLFDDHLPPLVIDLSPYWRPPAFASAIVVADAVAFEGADSDIVEPLLDDPDFAQCLLRALIYRIVTDRVGGFDQLRPDSDDPYRDVVELALKLSEHE